MFLYVQRHYVSTKKSTVLLILTLRMALQSCGWDVHYQFWEPNHQEICTYLCRTLGRSGGKLHRHDNLVSKSDGGHLSSNVSHN